MTTAGYDALRLDRQLCFALHAASRAVVRSYGPVLAAHGVTYPQYLAMLVLWEDAAVARTVGELGTALQTDSSTLTPLVKRLERDGLVQRKRDPQDERRVLVALTDAGLALRDEVVDVPMTVGSRFGMSLDEAGALKRRLEQLTAALEAASTA